MRTCPIALGLAVAGLVVAALPAAAQEPVTVEAANFSFTPMRATVAVGQTVRFANAGGFHNVHFAGEAALFAPALPEAPAWQAGPSRTFSTAGEYRFLCDPHAERGMTGTVVVQAPVDQQAPSPTPIPEPVPGAPAPAPAAPPAPAPASPVDAAAPAAIRRLELAGERFCTQSGRACRRPGVVLLVELTTQGELAGRLERRRLGSRAAYRAFGRLELGAVPAGLRSVRFSRTTSGRRLTPGRYRLRVTLDGRAARTLRFVVRAS